MTTDTRTDALIEVLAGIHPGDLREATPAVASSLRRTFGPQADAVLSSGWLLAQAGVQTRDRDEIWAALDWALWGHGIGNAVREPMADVMLAALSDDQHQQALTLFDDWKARRGHPSNLYIELREQQNTLVEAAKTACAALSVALRYADGTTPDNTDKVVELAGANQALAGLEQVVSDAARAESWRTPLPEMRAAVAAAKAHDDF
jgi:hypothetical protein